MLHDNAELRSRITAIRPETPRDIVSVAEQSKVSMPRTRVDASAEQPTGDRDQTDIADARTSDTVQSKIPLSPPRPTAARKRKPVAPDPATPAALNASKIPVFWLAALRIYQRFSGLDGPSSELKRIA